LFLSADVLQSKLTAVEFLALLVGDGDEPEPLSASLLQGLGQDVAAAGRAGVRKSCASSVSRSGAGAKRDRERVALARRSHA
jgi:hypothetical protein